MGYGPLLGVERALCGAHKTSQTVVKDVHLNSIGFNTLMGAMNQNISVGICSSVDIHTRLSYNWSDSTD